MLPPIAPAIRKSSARNRRPSRSSANRHPAISRSIQALASRAIGTSPSHRGANGRGAIPFGRIRRDIHPEPRTNEVVNRRLTRRTTASGRASRSAAAWRQHPMNGVQRSLIDLLDAFCQDLLLHGATHPRERIECCVDSILYGLATVWANHETHLDGDGTVCALLVRMRLEARAWLGPAPSSADAGAPGVRLPLAQ